MLEKVGGVTYGRSAKKATVVFNVFELLVKIEDGEGWAAD